MTENLTKKLDAILEKEVDEGRVCGNSAMVVKDGKVVYCHAYGIADTERGFAMKRNTIIRLYSMTKPITAVAVMICAERGLFDLMEPIAKYLPMFANQKMYDADGNVVPVQKEITIWDLLNMTSGIPYPDMSHPSGQKMAEVFGRLKERREKGEPADTMEFMDEIAKVPLAFLPGETWMYGLSADVLGALVEAVSGMRYGEFLKKEIFEPLDMVDTAFFVPQEKRDRFAQIYLNNPETGKPEPADYSHLGEWYGEDVAFESGGAGLVSTLDDYSHFATMMINKGVYGGRRILKEETVERMTKDAMTDKQKEGFSWESMKGYGYGYLMRVMTEPDKEGVSEKCNGNPGSFGWDGWTGNYVLMDPVDKMVYMYFVQKGDVWWLPVIQAFRKTAAELKNE